MAESVARVKIQATADLKGFDDATKALKDLQRAVGPTDAALEEARRQVLDFAAANKRSEAVIQAQLAAFQKLRQQAEMGGKVYNDLGRDIEKLKQVASSSTGALTKLGQAVNSAGRSTSGQSVWQQQSKELAAFNRQAGQTGKALSELAGSFGVRFEKTSQALQEASRQINILKQNASSIGALGQGPAAGGGAFEIGRKGMRDIGAFSTLVKGLKEQSETATGKVARLSEGLFALGATGAAVGQVTSALGGVAGAAERVSSFGANLSATFAQMGASTPAWSGGIKAGLNQIALALNQPASGIAQWSQSLAGVQAKLTMLNGPLEAFTNGLAAIGPEGAAAAGVMAVAFAGLQDGITRAFRAGEKEASEALQGITNETQQLLQKLSQLSEAFRSAASMRELQALRAGAAARFNETPAGTDASRRAANTIANAEARIKAEGQAQAAVLEEARKKYRGTSESVDALSERLAYLQSAMKLVDQSTTEGKAEFAAFSSEAGRVKKQIDDLSQSYRTVADAIRDAAAAQGQYANQSTTANYFNRAAVRRQEEIAQAAREALAQPQMALLPAAGQTSFAGQYGPGGIGGGARMGTGAKEFTSVLGTEQIGQGITAIYKGLERTQMEADATAAALERGFNRAGAAIDSAEKQVDELQRELNQALNSGARAAEVLTKLDFVNPRSIDALKQRRDQIDRERNSVDMLSDKYRELSRELGKIEGKIERTQVGGLRGKVGYIGQGIGAAASAGIFGGPEGLLGGLGGGAIGALLGGPAGFAAGAFTGSSIGAYAGMGRQQIGGFATYAADISKQEIALKGITKTQEEYTRALAASAAVTRDFNVPQLEATRGMTQLSAAVIGAGGKVADAEVVFRNVTAAIKASGGSSEDVQGSLTALAQIFSKGKVSAEELQGQLGERLPGAVTMFAKATGRTLPQLQKDLEQGVVGLADLMKFVISDQGLGQFEQRAKTVAQSSADAGARMTVAFNETKRAIGEALLPLGAQIQDSLANALRDATPALVSFAQSVGAAIKVLVDNAGLIGNVLKTLLAFAAVGGAAVGVTQLANAVKALTLLTTGVTGLSGALGVAKASVQSLIITMGAIPGIGWAAAAVVGLGLLTKAVYDTNDTFKNWVDNIGGVVANDFKAALRGMKEDAKSTFDFIGDLLPDYEEKSAKSQQNVSDGWTKAFKSIANEALWLSTAIQDSFAGLFDKLPPWARKFLVDNAAGTSAGLAVRVANYVKDASGRAVAIGARSNSYVTGTEYMGPGGSPKSSLPDDVLTRWETAQQQKKDKEDKDRLRQEQLQQQTDEALAKARIALDDAVHRNAMELIRKRYEYEQELAGKQRDNWVKSLTGAARSAGSLISGFLNEFDQLDNRLMQSREAVSSAEQKLKSTQTMSSVTVGGTSGNQAAQGYISKEQLRAWLISQGMGRTSGDFTNAGHKTPNHMLNAMDMGFTSSKYDRNYVAKTIEMERKLRATGAFGNQLFGPERDPRGHKDHLHVPTPGGRVQMTPGLANLMGMSGGGTGAAARRDIGAEGQADVAGVDLKSAQQVAKLTKDQIEQLKKLVGEGFVLDFTDQIRQQNAEMKNSAEITGLRNRLQLEGQRPEYIDGEIKKAEVAQRIAQENDAARQALERLTAAGEGGSDEARRLAAGMAENNTRLTEFTRLTNEATAAQIAFNDAMRFRQDMRIGEGLREGAQQYIESIGTMREATSQLAQAGIKGVEDAIFSLVTTGKANFREFAADILRQTARMIIQQLILRTIMQAIGAIGGGGAPLGFGGAGDPLGAGGAFWNANGNAFAKNGIVPYAMGGIVNKPTLFKFANGGAMRTGVMGEAGPEAIMPLKRGRDGKLGVSGGGGGDINVSVSVDATGSQVQGDSSRGEQLGRVVAQAVQSELLKQKRPGGLLAA